MQNMHNSLHLHLFEINVQPSSLQQLHPVIRRPFSLHDRRYRASLGGMLVFIDEFFHRLKNKRGGEWEVASNRKIGEVVRGSMGL